MKLAMKFNRDIFLTAHLLIIGLPLTDLVTFGYGSLSHNLRVVVIGGILSTPKQKHHRIGNAHLLGVDLMPRRTRKP